MRTAYDRVLRQITENTALARVTRDVAEAQEARWAAMIGESAAQVQGRKLAEAQEARWAAMIGESAAQVQGRKLAEAQEARWAAAIGGTLTPPVAQSFAVDALEPLLRRVQGAPLLHVQDIAQRVGTAQLRAYERTDVSGLAGLLDEADAVDQLVGSPELRSVVQDLVESEPVRELLEHVDATGLTEADAAEVFDHVAMTLTPAGQRPDRLTMAQVVVIFAAINVLVIAAVAAIYGFDVGLVADILAWPLSVLGIYGFAAVLGQRYSS